ncbi:MAG: DMT family transporter [Anaerolineales bacterium]
MSRWKLPSLSSPQVQGVLAALLSAVVLGLSPVFGKQAINAGTPWLTVVMLRTVAATGLLWLTYLSIRQLRLYTYIYPVGLVGCLAAGLINGAGSLMYYNGLGRLDAALAQLIYMLYPLFLTLLAQLDGYSISRFTIFRLALAIAAVYLLVGLETSRADPVGVALMLGGSVMYALHLVVNQRMLQEMPAPTVTLYTLTAMSATVVFAYFVKGRPILPPNPIAWQAVTSLMLATLLSRLMLFMGVKRLGSVQAALLGLSELFITVVGAHLLLDEKLTPAQWLGTGLLGFSVLLITHEKSLGVLPTPKPWLRILTARFTTPSLPPAPPPPAPVKSSPGEGD